MVLGKDNALNTHNTTTGVVGTGAQTQTTITTRTTEVPGAQVVQPTNVVQKEAVITNVMEKPVLGNVIEKKNVEVHHKNVVQEIHEQKIIEIEKQPVLQTVQQGTVVQQQKAATQFQEIGSGAIGEEERLRLEKLRLAQAPTITQQQGAVRQVQEGEQVAQVVRQEFVERHVQPVITEVREQNIVQEVVHPVVRKVHEGTIIREVQSAPLTTIQSAPVVQQQSTLVTQTTNVNHGYTQDSGRFAAFPARFVPSSTVHATNVQNPNALRTITGAGKNYFYALSNAGELYHLTGKDSEQSWTHIPTNGIALRDISVGRGGAMFGIGLNNGALYKFHRNEFELVSFTENNTRLSQLSVQSKRKIYALGEDGSAYFIKLARFGHNHTWTRLGGKLKKISSGGRLLRRTEVWGVGVDGIAYRWFNDVWVPFNNVQLLDISVAMDNAVYGVTREGLLTKWDGHNNFVLQNRELTGNAQYLSNARLSGVSAYKENRGVYGLEQGTSNVLKMIAL